MKAYRYIAALLLICFSAFLGHNLVPHQHHSEAFQSPLTSNCPYEHGDQHGHNHDGDTDTDTNEEELPVHCHAFNDVVFVKYQVHLNKPGSGQVLAMVVPGQILVPDVPALLTSSPFRLLKLACRSHTDVGTRALRAPPAFA